MEDEKEYSYNFKCFRKYGLDFTKIHKKLMNIITKYGYPNPLCNDKKIKNSLITDILERINEYIEEYYEAI